MEWNETRDAKQQNGTAMAGMEQNAQFTAPGFLACALCRAQVNLHSCSIRELGLEGAF